MLHTHRNMSGLEVTIKSPAPVFAGEPALFRASTQNKAPFTRVNVWLFCQDFTEMFACEPAASVEVPVPVKTTGRGYIECPPLRLSSAYPLGLLYTWSGPIRGDARGVVYPAPSGELPLPRERGLARFSESARTLEGDDFSGLREYQHGDPPRHIHWKAAATYPELLTKQFGGDGSEEVWLDMDWVAGDTESRLGQLCRWVRMAEREGIRYGLKVPGTRIEPDSGSEHYHRCLQTLALWGLPDAPVDAPARRWSLFRRNR